MTSWMGTIRDDDFSEPSWLDRCIGNVYWFFYQFKGCEGVRHFWCRLRLHPKGPIYYNPGGLEPDWRCRDCGEYLG